ncbi:lecithin retinol acyltransferase family protein [Clostridium perfringens]|nr:lecithin retinol acyltransferase family protein [Clostridium perfringens]EJT6656469.1 lecithin retinol acyltransferase family protein [Clostridium perfringens]
MDSINKPVLLKLNEDEKEIWSIKKPSKGDHIRVNRGIYSHHGIYVSDEEVIHFTGTEDDSILDWSKNEVIKTGIDYFLRGGKLEVKEYTEDELSDLYPVEHIVIYARACLGDRGYNLVFNNCEHFANVCTLGRFRSKQVENVFLGIWIEIWRSREMGIFDKVGGFFKGLFGVKSNKDGNRSASNYNYEPDKLRIAEIEAETKIRLTNMENERIRLSKEAQIEIMEEEYRFKVALEEAKAIGFNNIATTIIGMQEKLNEISQKRIEIIEKGSLKIVSDIENFYLELKGKIEQENYKYSEEKLPKLFEVLEKFDENSPAYKLYLKRIEDDMILQLKSYEAQIEGISIRQSKIMDSFLSSKEKMINQNNQITNFLISNSVTDEENSILKLDERNKFNKSNLLKSGQK